MWNETCSVDCLFMPSASWKHKVPFVFQSVLSVLSSPPSERIIASSEAMLSKLLHEQSVRLVCEVYSNDVSNRRRSRAKENVRRCLNVFFSNLCIYEKKCFRSSGGTAKETSYMDFNLKYQISVLVSGVCTVHITELVDECLTLL